MGNKTPDIVALVDGQPLAKWPSDLFIPPDALMVLLDFFSGPLDLLLYLIRKQNIDILNIPMEAITRQYMQYIRLMQASQLDLAAEYLLMAATLAEIKSRMLLPRPPPEEGQEESDPRMDLVRRLQAYEKMKAAAESLDNLPRQERDIFKVRVSQVLTDQPMALPQLSLAQLVDAIAALNQRQKIQAHHYIKRENFSVRERMQRILDCISADKPINLYTVWNTEDGRGGFIACFLAVLELCKLSLVRMQQSAPFEPVILHGIKQ